MRAIVCSVILPLILWMSPATALPPEVEFDLLLMQAIEDTEAGRYEQAIEQFEALAQLGEAVLELVTENDPDAKDNMTFYLAKSALYTRSASQRLYMLDLYFTEFGRGGLHYRDALELYAIGEEMNQQADAVSQAAEQQGAVERNQNQVIIDHVKNIFREFTGVSIDTLNTRTYNPNDGSAFALSEYRGEERAGLGLYIWFKEDGYTYYAGNYADGERDGQGVFGWANGDVYEGNWRQGKRTGEGEFTSTDGTHYEGNWLENRREGFGIEIYQNGWAYVGDWRNNLWHDNIATYGDKVTRYGAMRYGFDGEFVEGELVKGSYYAENGNYYYGEFRDFAYHGQGELRFPESNQFRYGASCKGNFRNGVLVGIGEASVGNRVRRCEQVGSRIEFFVR